MDEKREEKAPEVVGTAEQQESIDASCRSTYVDMLTDLFSRQKLIKLK